MGLRYGCRGHEFWEGVKRDTQREVDRQGDIENNMDNNYYYLGICNLFTKGHKVLNKIV